jgi:hypothetical protein
MPDIERYLVPLTPVGTSDPAAVRDSFTVAAPVKKPLPNREYESSDSTIVLLSLSENNAPEMKTYDLASINKMGCGVTPAVVRFAAKEGSKAGLR